MPFLNKDRQKKQRNVLDKPSAFAPREKKRFPAEPAEAAQSQESVRPHRRPRANRVIAILIVLSLAVSIAQIAFQVFFFPEKTWSRSSAARPMRLALSPSFTSRLFS